MSPHVESIFHDARFGLRTLRRNPVVTAAAVVSLSLAIGACTAAFSLIDALILRPLPVHDPPSLFYLTYPDRDVRGTFEGDSFSYPLFARLRDKANRQVDLFGITFGGGLQAAAFDRGEEERVRAQWISGDGFQILGIQPALGRLLTADDDRQSESHSIAVLSHTFWSRRFGADPGVLGQLVTLNGKQFEIAGVAQAGFSGAEHGYLTDLWLPLVTRVDARSLIDANQNWFKIWARLKPGVAREQARQVLQAAFTNSRRDRSKDVFHAGTPPDQIANFVDAPLSLMSAARGRPSMLRQQFERPLWILAVVVGLVLLIACANVANLLVARAAAREREIAMRVSIGASRFRLIQQTLIESSLIAVAACLVGLAFASAAAPPIVDLLSPTDYPAYLDLHIDWRVLTFIALIGVLTTLGFGMAPALRVSAISPNTALQEGGGKHSGRIGVLRPLLVAQVGFSFVVLFLAGLLLLSFQNLTNLDLGFEKTGIVLFTLAAKDIKQPDQARVIGLQLLDHIRQLPAVQAASLSSMGLIGGAFAPVMTPAIRFPGREPESIRPYFLEVSPGFFETMRIRLLEGRDFDARDTEPQASAVIVNQAFARRYFPGENSIGKRFDLTGDYGAVPRQIIGVARDAKYNDVREAVGPTVYVPLRRMHGATLEARTSVDPLTIASTLRAEIQRVHPSLRITNVSLQSTRIDNTLLRERLMALLSGFFGIVAVVLVAVGLYGVLTYSVVRQTREIGIRVALGARQFSIVRLVMADMLLMTAVGIAAGLGAGIILARFVASFLFEVKPSDFWSLALPLASLLFATTLAALAPAVRAARVDPIVALRHE